MAAWASASVGISTKPNPRDWPVAPSLMMRIVVISPNAPNAWRRSSSVVSLERLPTWIFIDIPFAKIRDPKGIPDTTASGRCHKKTLLMGTPVVMVMYSRTGGIRE